MYHICAKASFKRQMSNQVGLQDLSFVKNINLTHNLCLWVAKARVSLPTWSGSTFAQTRLTCRETGLSPPVKKFYWPFHGGTSFVDHLCFLCHVFFMLLRLFIAAMCSLAGKGLTSGHVITVNLNVIPDIVSSQYYF